MGILSVHRYRCHSMLNDCLNYENPNSTLRLVVLSVHERLMLELQNNTLRAFRFIGTSLIFS